MKDLEGKLRTKAREALIDWLHESSKDRTLSDFEEGYLRAAREYEEKLNVAVDALDEIYNFSANEEDWTSEMEEMWSIAGTALKELKAIRGE